MKVHVLILTKNEEIHLERCLKSVKPIAKTITIIDSGSLDKTKEISQKFDCYFIFNNWINYSKQFNFGLQTLEEKYNGQWVMRLDADEILDTELINFILNLEEKNDFDGIVVDRKLIYQGKWIKYGGYFPIKLLRFWRIGEGSIENRQMDEHVVLRKPLPNILDSKKCISDVNLNNMIWWSEKHLGYAKREAFDYFSTNYSYINSNYQASTKKNLKNSYYKLPPYFRAFIYFCYRYFFRFGFLDGSKGFRWHFFQGFWYRMIVDHTIEEIRRDIEFNGENFNQVIKKLYSN